MRRQRRCNGAASAGRPTRRRAALESSAARPPQAPSAPWNRAVHMREVRTMCGAVAKRQAGRERGQTGANFKRGRRQTPPGAITGAVSCAACGIRQSHAHNDAGCCERQTAALRRKCGQADRRCGANPKAEAATPMASGRVRRTRVQSRWAQRKGGRASELARQGGRLRGPTPNPAPRRTQAVMPRTRAHADAATCGRRRCAETRRVPPRPRRGGRRSGLPARNPPTPTPPTTLT